MSPLTPEAQPAHVASEPPCASPRAPSPARTDLHALRAAAGGPYRPYRFEGTPERLRTARTMPLRGRELLAAIALVATADFLVWGGLAGNAGVLAGLSFGLFFLVVPAIVLAAARARRLSLRTWSIGVMLAAVAARCAFYPTLGTVFFGLFGIFALAIAMRARNVFVTNIAASFGLTIRTFPRRIAAAVRGASKFAGAPKGGAATIFVPVALVFSFVGIFALANPLVGGFLAGVAARVALPAPARAAFWLVLLLGALLLVRPAVRFTIWSEDAETRGDATESALLTARNTLLSLNVLFFFYNVIDARYLLSGPEFSGRAADGVLVLAEQHAAHEGCAWITFALLLMTVVIGTMFRGALAEDVRAHRTRIFAFAWIAQGLVLAMGAFGRELMHIARSGLSDTRILGIIGTTLVVLGLVLVGMKLRRHRTFAWLLRRQLDAACAGVFLFCVLPTHLIAAHINVSRVLAHEYEPLVNIGEEAREPESVAALLPLLDHDDERVRRGVATLLLREIDALYLENYTSTCTPRSWRQKSLASVHALSVLESARGKASAVLGDVDRNDAATAFTYVRNSSFEGPIADSEISKVPFAESLPAKAVREWVMQRDLSLSCATQSHVLLNGLDTMSCPIDTRVVASGSDQSVRHEAKVSVIPYGGGTARELTMVLESVPVAEPIGARRTCQQETPRHVRVVQVQGDEGLRSGSSYEKLPRSSL